MPGLRGSPTPCPRLSTDRSALGGFAASAGKQVSKNLAHMALTVGRPVGRKSAAPSAVGRWRDMLLGTSADASGSPGGGGRRCAFPPYGTVQQSTPYERRILTRRKRGGPRRATEKAAMRCARCRNRRPREAPKFLASPWPSAASSVLEAFTCLRCSQRPGRITGARRPPRATIGECRRVPGGGGDLATPPHHLCQRISAFSAGTKTPGCAGTTRTV